jgi:DNA-binding response OmpR family regulator
MSKRILIIDDEQMVLDTMDSILTEMGYSVVTCPEPDDGEREAVTRDFDLVLVDIRMPRTNGAELTESILGARPESRILVITGYPSDPLVQRALDAGARGVVKKPFEIAKVLEYLPDQTI